MKSLENKVAVVTGASKGIGAGIAKSFAQAGAAVVVNYAGSRAGAESIVEEIKREGGQAIAIQADVSNADQVDTLFKAAVDTFGKVDVLVNNAGVFEFASVDEIREDQFSRMFSVNVWGPILTTQKALGHFPAEGGSIINISSSATRMLSPGSALYSGTKGALDLITVILSKELGSRQIRINAISPGATETEGAHSAGAMSDQSKARYTSLTPLGRVGQPNDIARLAVFLASDEAAWITGEVIHANGGLR